MERLRKGIPNVTLRTTYMVGFPGEGEEDFARLCDFVRETRFDRVGVFRYSDEEGTAAHALPGKVPQTVARERYRLLLEIQKNFVLISLKASRFSLIICYRIGVGIEKVISITSSLFIDIFPSTDVYNVTIKKMRKFFQLSV